MLGEQAASPQLGTRSPVLAAVANRLDELLRCLPLRDQTYGFVGTNRCEGEAGGRPGVLT